MGRIPRDQSHQPARFLSWEDLDAYSYELECVTRYED